MKEMIKIGMTNVSYKEDGEFVQEQIYTGFNHKIDYELLKNFSFVPKLISNKDDILKWEYVNGKQPEMNDENILKVARHLKVLHNSNLPFPSSNHAARVKKYRSILKEKNINIEVLNEFYRSINLTLSKMDKTTPLHNDLWPWNMIENQNGKIFFIDWEYATLGDKHFDLAYFIESSQMTNEQQKLFLNEYGEYNAIYLLKHRILVNYLVILWVNAQEKIHFSYKPFSDKIYQLNKELEELLKTI
ncbi:phosphotransferase [Mycoplasmopsis lipofaciens]|uniref:phosphotransferase n=1 Tax=Mycoplasmopsis lipofaciens TaxID=114884 RepID=UPI000487B7A5|nr:phosphotransferase [Mycoplasmopsis lipofaciens]